MALVVKDRVKETSTTSGTGTLTLAGAASGFQAFSAVGDGNTTYYAIIDGTDWEVGLGTYTSSGTTLARTTVLASTNSNNAVNLSSSSKDVFVVYPASKAIYGDAEGNVTIKATETGDDKPAVLLLQTGETDIAADDALGKVQFQAPDEAAGTDAILVAAEIAAVSEGDFSASSNATKLSFKTGASEAATEKMSLSSGGNLTLPTDGAVVNFGAGSDVTLTHDHDSGLTLSAGANHTHFTISSTEDGVNAGPRLSLTRNSASPDDGDDLGIIYFKGENDNDEEISYARIYAEAVDVSDGSEDGRLRLQVMRAGSQTTVIMADDDEVEITGALNATGTIFANGGMLKSQGTGTTTGTALLTTDSGGTYCTRVLNSGSLITGTKASSPVNHTTGSAANVFVSASGYIRKSTSSLRYKKDVQDLDPSWADKVLDFKPIFFKSDCPKVEGDSHEPDEWTYYGFAAEQVGTIDPRYVFWNREKVEWSDEGRKSTSLIDSDNPHGQAEGVQYDRITVALVDIIKRQKTAIESLESEMTALKTRVATLEAS